MSDDLFSAGFAWDEGVASLATPDATHPAAASTGDNRRQSASIDAHASRTVTTVSQMSQVSQNKFAPSMSQDGVADFATPVATAETADFRDAQALNGSAVARVASVANWTEGVNALTKARTHPSIHGVNWAVLVADARQFLALWAKDAVALGWGTLDVFGTNRNPSAARLDRTGLVTLLAGRTIQAMDEDTALIGTGRSTSTFYRRFDRQHGVAVWELLSSSPAVAAGDGGRGGARKRLPPHAPPRQPCELESADGPI